MPIAGPARARPSRSGSRAGLLPRPRRCRSLLRRRKRPEASRPAPERAILLWDETQGSSTESPLPLWERDRVRGLAPAGADEFVDGKRSWNLDSAGQLAYFQVADRARSLRAAARVPSPCPSPTRGEGTLYDGPAMALIRSPESLAIPEALQ